MPCNCHVHPLGVIDDPQQMERDLMYYESKVDKDGPAMTFSSFAVQYARLGNSEMAGKMFDRSYKPNQLPPFGVLAETPGNDNPYFITGAGGMLQAILFGFGGLDITENGLVQQKTILPPGWTKLVIKGVGPQKKTYVITNDK